MNAMIRDAHRERLSRIRSERAERMRDDTQSVVRSVFHVSLRSLGSNLPELESYIG